MKTAFLIFFVIFVAFFIGSNEGSHSKKQKSKVKNEEGAGPGSQEPGDISDWPHPGTVGNFDVPEDFTETGGNDQEIGENDETSGSSGRHRGRSHKDH